MLVIGVVLDLLISAALLVQNQRTQNALNQAHIAKVAAYETCIAGNDFRSQDLSRWNAVLTLLDTEPMNPDLQRFIAGVRKANGLTDAPRDCTKVLP